MTYISILLFVVILGVLVFVHELGHFLAARWMGIHIEEFGFGFPPRLIGVVRDRAGHWRLLKGMQTPKAEELGGPCTIYSLNMIPVGGFVRPAGEDNPNVPGGLASASKRARLVVLAAGATFNLVLAYLIFVVGFMTGWPAPTHISVNRVEADSPAAAVGLRAGDVIRQVDTLVIQQAAQISTYVSEHRGQPVALSIERGGQTLVLEVTPRVEVPAGQGPIGFEMKQHYAVVYYPPWEAAYRAAGELGRMFVMVVEIPVQALRGAIDWLSLRPVGLVAMNDMTRGAIVAAEEVGAVYPVLQLFGIISVGLALTQLLPLPALDGGRIVFVLLEAVRGRRIDPLREGVVHAIGMLALLTLMVVITYFDIVYPVFPR